MGLVAVKSFMKSFVPAKAKPIERAASDAAALLQQWEARRNGRFCPAWADFPVVDLRHWLGSLNLLDVVDEGADFRFRVYGTRMAEMMGHELTGKLVSELPEPRLVEASLHLYRTVLERRAPQFAFHQAPRGASRGFWLRLVMPLASSGDRIDRLMGYGQPLVPPIATRRGATPALPEIMPAAATEGSGNIEMLGAMYAALAA